MEDVVDSLAMDFTGKIVLPKQRLCYRNLVEILYFSWYQSISIPTNSNRLMSRFAAAILKPLMWVNFFSKSVRRACDMHRHMSKMRFILEQSIILPFQAWRCDTTTMFMQDGAPPHRASCVKQVLRRHFADDRIIN
ncbi:hypothetical protein TNCV_924751 [Trichonephila clavipes]|nr:hypothetical protein TNCV_924751 [Trichonephila clavipes]